MKRLLISSLLVTFFLGTTALLAQPQNNFGPGPNGGPNFGPRGFHGLGVLNILKLTDEQNTAFNDIRYKHQMEVIDLQAELNKNRIKVRKMMADNNVNADELLQLTSANNDIHGKLRTSKTQMWLDVYNILDDTQKEIWTEHFNRMGMGKNGRGPGKGLGRNNCMGNGKPGFGPRGFQGYNQQ